MTSPAVSQPVYPGTTSHGAAWKEVQVLAVDYKASKAVVRDSFGQTMQIRCDIMRAKGNLPAINERWLIDRQYGTWTFAAIMNGGTDGVIIPPESVTGLPQTLGEHVDLINNVDNQALARDQDRSIGRVTSRGDLLVGDGLGSVVRQPVGLANNLSLVSDSGSATGVSYKDMGGRPMGYSGIAPLTNPVRWVGSIDTTPSAAWAPASGTWLKGDFVTTSIGHLWICQTAGTPGVWVSSTQKSSNRLDVAESQIGGMGGWGNHSSQQLNASWGTGAVQISGLGVLWNAGIATMTGYGCIPNRPGRWNFNYNIYTNAGSAGLMVAEMRWPGGGFAWPQKAIGWRGGGYAQGGQLQQQISWTGVINATAATKPLTCWIDWFPQTAGIGLDAGANDYFFEANFLGDVIW